MLFNIIAGFVLPWIFGMMLYRKDKKVVLTVVPFTSVVSHTMNAVGYTLGFWKVKPTALHALSALPMDVGIYALLGGYMIYLVRTKKIKWYLLILVFTLATTIIEYIAFLTGHVLYENGWNIFGTFFSYLIPYTLVYGYYSTMKKAHML